MNFPRIEEDELQSAWTHGALEVPKVGYEQKRAEPLRRGLNDNSINYMLLRTYARDVLTNQ
jgi:hypothetical protein